MLAPSTDDDLAPLGVRLETAPCALCGSSASTPLLVGEDRAFAGPGRFQLVQCDACGLLRTDPRPSRATIHRYYPADYAPYQRQAVVRPQPTSRWLDRRVAVMPPVAPPGRLLEIGTSFGAFLHQCKLAGWDVTGVEFDAAMAARAAEVTGAPVHAASIEAVQFAPSSFDVICAWQVIEHLHDPVRAVRRCFEWLKPGGWLTFAVPDAGSLDFRVFRDRWFALELPRHLYHFTPSTSRAMLEICRFEDIRLVRPRTIYTGLRSATRILADRGWIASGRERAIADSLPARLINVIGGYTAAALGNTATFTMMGRKPR